MMSLKESYDRIVEGRHGDPFSLLGPHNVDGVWTVHSWHPQADNVELLDHNNNLLAAMERVHADGLFAARLSAPVIDYRLKIFQSDRSVIVDDPYRFASQFGELDRHLMSEGTVTRLETKLGANLMQSNGVTGVNFSVWAPNAGRVSVIGGFNSWDGRRHPMRFHPGSGVWDIFIPGVGQGERYKFELLDKKLRLLPVKTDPFARRMQGAPGNASIVHQDAYQWRDRGWLSRRKAAATLDQAMSIYEVHLGSWRRQGNNQVLSYRQLAETLVPYVAEMAYTHIELLPISEHPFYGSWGYQPIGLFAPTYRFGSPEDFKYLVDACHAQNIGVIMDWVPAHFPRDEFGLGRFDGTHLYEHADPRKGLHPDWDTLIFNLSRPEVVNYLLANATFWVEEYHIDALRVDAVASLLYLDYSREYGQWLPNKHGGNENLEAVEFLRQLNTEVHARGAITIAEESTSWPRVSHPVYNGGLGFSYKWNMGWMNDTLDYFSVNPVHRRYHHDRLTFGLLYVYSENFVLPISHDEVVHGKGSVFERMPGDYWQKMANMRLFYAFMYCYPGKKLMFMGCEFGQRREWNHDTSLDWDLLKQLAHEGVRKLVRELNRLYRNTPALSELDFDRQGFEWIDCSDRKRSVISFVRRGKKPQDFVIVVCNLTPVVRHAYRIGAAVPGRYVEILNSDALEYGGSGVGNLGAVNTDAISEHGQQQSLNLSLPPLGALILQPA